MSSVWMDSLEEYMSKMKEAKDVEIFIFKRKTVCELCDKYTKD